TAGQSFVQIAERISRYTGGISFNPYTTTHSADANLCLRRAQFGIKFLDENVEPAMELLRELMFALDPHDTARLRDVVTQSAAAHKSQIVERGLGIAQRQAARFLNAENCVADLLGGLPQTRLMTRLGDQFD